MATSLSALRAPQSARRPDVESDFLDQVLQKTEENKIEWERTKGGYQGLASDGRFSFTLLISSGVFGPSWTNFSVRKADQEIFRLETATGTLLTLAGVAEGAKHAKVSKLLNFLESSKNRDLQAALTELESL